MFDLWMHTKIRTRIRQISRWLRHQEQAHNNGASSTTQSSG